MTSQTAPVRAIATAPSQVARQAAGRHRRPWVWFTVVVLAAFFGLIGSRISLDQSAFTIDRLHDEIAAAQARNMDLQLEIAELRDPDRIAPQAAAMGMTFPRRQLPLDVESKGAGAGPGRGAEGAQLEGGP